MDALHFSATGSEQLLTKVAALVELNATMQARLEAVAAEAADKLAEQASAAVLQENASKGEKPYHQSGPGLRDRISEGVGTAPFPGGVRVTTSAEGSQVVIPRGLDGVRGWRHPVFGNRNVWVTQKGSFSWFSSTMKDNSKMITASMVGAVNEAAQEVSRA